MQHVIRAAQLSVWFTFAVILGGFVMSCIVNTMPL